MIHHNILSLKYDEILTRIHTSLNINTSFMYGISSKKYYALSLLYFQTYLNKLLRKVYET